MPKKYKCNVIIGDLYRSKRISTVSLKTIIIINKLKKADFSTKYIDSVIKRFDNNKRIKDQEDDFVIPRT